MRVVTGLLIVASMGTLTSVFAASPPESPPAGSANKSASMPAKTDAQPVASSDQAPKHVLTAAELERLKAAGYVPETHGSEIRFCRKEVVLGSRFERKICRTVDQLIRPSADAGR